MKIPGLIIIVLAALTALITSATAQCPTGAAQPACNSYKELIDARDKNLTLDSVRYICFDDTIDRFIVIYVTGFQVQDTVQAQAKTVDKTLAKASEKSVDKPTNL